jgi:hypothetical protein
MESKIELITKIRFCIKNYEKTFNKYIKRRDKCVDVQRTLTLNI